jgi:UrcA family protein
MMSAMPRYLVERHFPDGLQISIDNAGVQACRVVTENNLQEGVTWAHSYVSPDKKRSFCIYDGPTPEAIRRAASRNKLPDPRDHRSSRTRSIFLQMKGRMTMKTAIRCTLLAVLMTSLNAVAAAVELGDEPAKRIVHFADLDLTRSVGVAVLYARIKFAARDVCEPVNDRDLAAVVSTRRCMEQAIARAIADVNAPTVTSYYLAKTGQTITVAQQR